MQRSGRSACTDQIWYVSIAALENLLIWCLFEPGAVNSHFWALNHGIKAQKQPKNVVMSFEYIHLQRSDPPYSNQSSGLTMGALTNWLDAYGDAWESKDPDKAANLFSADASYRVTPFEKPHSGPEGIREYWANVTAGQRNVEFQFEPLAVAGNTGFAQWSATFDVDPDGPSITLDGVFVLDFDENGKCQQLREWWHLKTEESEG